MEQIRSLATQLGWGTLLIGWLVALAPIMAINALSQMKHGRETTEAESGYNRLAFFWLAGFMPLLVMANVDVEVAVGIGWTLACLMIAVAYLFFRGSSFFQPVG